MINVEVIYALPGRHERRTLQLPEHSSVADAVAASGLTELFPEINAHDLKVGIFGRVASSATVLREGDRVEIYRSLMSDPKETRRRRAARQKQHR